MTDEVRPVAPATAPDSPAVEERRERERRARDRRAAARADRALVPAGERVDHAAPPAKPAAPAAVSAAAFAAQVIGQTGQRRGLKGGPPVLDAARSTYLGREYSGAHDRRPPKGRTRKTEV